MVMGLAISGTLVADLPAGRVTERRSLCLGLMRGPQLLVSWQSCPKPGEFNPQLRPDLYFSDQTFVDADPDPNPNPAFFFYEVAFFLLRYISLFLPTHQQ
jgi:hypothetical protein